MPWANLSRVQVERRDMALAAGALLLLAVAVIRVAIPDGSRIRPLSIHGLDIPDEKIDTGQELQRTVRWNPPADVYVIGWSYDLGSAAARPELALMHGETQLFFVKGGGAAPVENPAFFGAGAAYRLRKEDTLELRYRLVNTGAPGQTNGARALVYFIPVEGN
jgi:hypothetical protein